jgi:aspartate-semialdehyde dehydrogenase
MGLAPDFDARIPVAVLGATGSVGQRFVELLEHHPWFELAFVGASPRSAGRPYGDVVRWAQTTPLPARAAELVVQPAEPPGALPPGVRLCFSALDADVAGPVEVAWAEAGALVVSNAKSHRMAPDVPLVVPEVNPAHLALLERQSFGRGGIVTNPNCSTIGLLLALAPLRPFGLVRAHVVTLQALSGAGLPGVPGVQAVDNVIPFIGGEEEKLALETQKILGELRADGIAPARVTISAQCNRVPVIDGHTECVSLQLEQDVDAEALVAAWRDFRAAPQELGLPSAPAHPTLYLDEPDAPQPRKHRDLERGMACSIGRLQPCPVLSWRFVCLSHNTLRGAAGGALLTAELAVAQRRLAPGAR